MLAEHVNQEDVDQGISDLNLLIMDNVDICISSAKTRGVLDVKADVGQGMREFLNRKRRTHHEGKHQMWNTRTLVKLSLILDVPIEAFFCPNLTHVKIVRGYFDRLRTLEDPAV